MKASSPDSLLLWILQETEKALNFQTPGGDTVLHQYSRDQKVSHLRVPGADARAAEEVCNAVTSHTREDTLSAYCNLINCRSNLRVSVKTSKHHTTQKFSPFPMYRIHLLSNHFFDKLCSCLALLQDWQLLNFATCLLNFAGLWQDNQIRTNYDRKQKIKHRSNCARALLKYRNADLVVAIPWKGIYPST